MGPHPGCRRMGKNQLLSASALAIVDMLEAFSGMSGKAESGRASTSSPHSRYPLNKLLLEPGFVKVLILHMTPGVFTTYDHVSFSSWRIRYGEPSRGMKIHAIAVQVAVASPPVPRRRIRG